jgi:hypothetical protein
MHLRTRVCPLSFLQANYPAYQGDQSQAAAEKSQFKKRCQQHSKTKPQQRNTQQLLFSAHTITPLHIDYAKGRIIYYDDSTSLQTESTFDSMGTQTWLP